MKNLKYLLVLPFYFFLIHLLVSQEIVTISVIDEKCNENNGVIVLLAIDDALNQFPLPWNLEIKDHTQDNWLYAEMKEKNYSIANLKAGNYTLIIYLDEYSSCKIELETEIKTYNPITITGDIKDICKNQALNLK